MPRILWILILAFAISLSACAPANESAQNKRQQADVHYKLATAHMQSNNPTLALKELLIAVEQDPRNSSIQVALGQVYQQKKAYELAEKHYLIALDLSDNDPRYQNNLATLYLDMQEWDKAISYFDKASSNLLFLQVHVAIAGKAYAYFKKNDFPTAVTYFKEVTTLAPGYAPAYYHLSEVYRAMDNTPLEKQNLERAINIAPQFIQARFRLATLLIAEDLKDEAAEELKTIIKYAPTSELGHEARTLLKTLSGS